MIRFCPGFSYPLDLGDLKPPTSQPLEELSLLFCLPCDIGGATVRSPGMMYFPILNEELNKTLWNPQNHRVVVILWIWGTLKARMQMKLK